MKYPKYPAYKDSGVEWIGEIPNGWVLIQLKWAMTIMKGKVPKNIETDFSETNDYLPYLSMEFLRGETSKQWVRFDNSTFVVDEGETLLLWDGSNAGEFIKSRRGILSSTVALVHSNKVNHNFLFYFCKAAEHKLKELTVGMGIPHVDGDLLKSLSMPFPLNEEQVSIGNFLDCKTTIIDRLVLKEKQIINLLKEKRQAIITNVVTKGLDRNVPMKDSGVEWIGKIPEHWKLKRLKYVVKLVNDKSERETTQIALENIESWSGKYLVTDDEFKGDGIRFQSGDILFGKLRPYLAKVYLAAFSGAAVGDFFVLRSFLDVEPNFLFNWLINREFINMVNSATYGAKMPRIDWGFMGELLVTIPPKEEQIKICDTINVKTSQIDALITKQHDMIEHLKEYKASLITQAVTGKMDVRGFAAPTDSNSA